MEFNIYYATFGPNILISVPPALKCDDIVCLTGDTAHFFLITNAKSHSDMVTFTPDCKACNFMTKYLVYQGCN